jgi:hypothetical protein
MPENTGQAESKPESKPEPKPSTEPVQGNEGKVRGKYVNYQDLSKEELVRMLMRVNKRLTRVNKELKEIINILYYGNTPQEGGGQENQGRKYQNSGYRNYRRNYSGNRQYGRYGYKGSYRQRRSEDEDEDVDYD